MAVGDLSALAIACAAAHVSKQRPAHIEGRQQKTSQQTRSPLKFGVGRFGFSFLHGNHCAEIFHEIHATFFASATMALLVVARGALEAKRCMAALTEPRHVASFGAAFGAFHRKILTCKSGGPSGSGAPAASQ